MEDEKVKQVYEKAKAAWERAYAPYSKFHVGVAIKEKGSEEIFEGCNVENVSFGATVCAERTAIFSSVARKGKVGFEFMVLVTDREKPVVPCGMCLQVMSEFCDQDFPIYIANLEGIKEKRLLKEFLPFAFSEF